MLINSYCAIALTLIQRFPSEERSVPLAQFCSIMYVFNHFSETTLKPYKFEFSFTMYWIIFAEFKLEDYGLNKYVELNSPPWSVDKNWWSDYSKTKLKLAALPSNFNRRKVLIEYDLKLLDLLVNIDREIIQLLASACYLSSHNYTKSEILNKMVSFYDSFEKYSAKILPALELFDRLTKKAKPCLTL